MFTLQLLESKPPIHLIDPQEPGPGITLSGEPPFVHFVHNFREIEPEKIAEIMQIILRPPRKPRSDAGKPRATKTAPPADPSLI